MAKIIIKIEYKSLDDFVNQFYKEWGYEDEISQALQDVVAGGKPSVIKLLKKYGVYNDYKDDLRYIKG